MSIEERVLKDPPYKLLALDGGGIRGALTIEILAEIEKIVRQKNNKIKVLSDYFDYIAGTSTGAILAAGLSLGWSVDKMRQFYHDSGEKMFDKAFFLKRIRYRFEDQPLRNLLQQEIGADVTLGSEKIKTLLMMVMRNATTDSPWPVSNNPYAKYNDVKRDDNNSDIPLWQLVRASTAAPVYFPPEQVTVGDKHFLFVDGGITSYNNPAFQMFLMATSEPYGLNWATGEDKMLIVSVGTGSSPLANDGLTKDDINILYNATKLPSALMNAAAQEQDFLCRTFGKCLSGDMIDREIGDMCVANEHSKCGGPVDPKLFSYVRYNAELTESGLKNLGLEHIEPKKVQKLDSVEGLAELQEIGIAVANKQIKKSHFDGF